MSRWTRHTTAHPIDVSGARTRAGGGARVAFRCASHSLCRDLRARAARAGILVEGAVFSWLPDRAPTMAPKEAKKRTPPGLKWKRLAWSPTGGTEVKNEKLAAALSSGQLVFTEDELSGFQIEGELGWKSFVHIDGTENYFTPLRPPRKDPLILVIFVGIFVLLSTYGFFWSLWKMGLHSYEFFTELDVKTPSGAAITLGSAGLFIAFCYYSFYPEGQLARDAIADRGAGRMTFSGEVDKNKRA